MGGARVALAQDPEYRRLFVSPGGRSEVAKRCNVLHQGRRGEVSQRTGIKGRKVVEIGRIGTEFA